MVELAPGASGIARVAFVDEQLERLSYEPGTGPYAQAQQDELLGRFRVGEVG